MIKLFFLFIVCSANPVLSNSQQFLPTEPPASETQIFNDIKKYGYNPDGTLQVAVSGSPYWSDVWYQGQLFDLHNASYGFYQVKIDLVNRQVHFLNKRRAEMVINEGFVNKVTIYDSSVKDKIVTVFRTNVPEIEALKNEKNCLVQELNQGNYKLLKLVYRKIASSDSMFGTLKRYFYKDENEYFIEKENKIEKLKKLSKENLLEQLPSSSTYKDWIEKQNLNFKKEKDCIQFLDYYNSSKKSN
jgi:hypothetical protein